MSYDRTWIHKLDELKEWTELGQSDKGIVDRLIALGNWVVLAAGRHFCFDELFLFKSSADAAEFYDHGFKTWESITGGEGEGCRFPGSDALAGWAADAFEVHAAQPTEGGSR